MLARLTVPIGEHDHVLGAPDAPVTLVEYGDFECPACGAVYPVVKELLKRAEGRVRFVFRHLPLATAHPHAESAALAAEAAARQDKFWAMHDLLFENQDALGRHDLVRLAASLGLDLKAFGEAMEDAALLTRVREDFAAGVRSGVNGTPTFFINGVRHDGPHHLPALQRAVEAA